MNLKLVKPKYENDSGRRWLLTLNKMWDYIDQL